jgi:outer membrane protein assembly factor BamB
MCGAEQLAAGLGNYECCECVGQLFAVSLETGAILWQAKTLPDRPTGHEGKWYSGASIWGSSFVVDEARGQIIVPIGNMYTVPTEVTECMGGGVFTTGCLPDDALGSSVASFNLRTGELLWNFRSDVYPYDAWNNGCTALHARQRELPGPGGVRL